jgi:5-formyltetrahydrofolate cyclo-ligase
MNFTQHSEPNETISQTVGLSLKEQLLNEIPMSESDKNLDLVLAPQNSE